MKKVCISCCQKVLETVKLNENPDKTNTHKFLASKTASVSNLHNAEWHLTCCIEGGAGKSSSEQLVIQSRRDLNKELTGHALRQIFPPFR